MVQDQYSLLTKNLSADIVDKIQVIENYNKNRLVGSILKSGEVAINLKLDKKINGKLSGSVSISYSDKKRGEFDGSLIYLKSKFKYIQIQNTNSVAKNVIGQNMFEPNTINNSEIPLDQKKTYYHSPISTSDIYSLDLPKEYILNNKSWLTAPVLFFNLSKSIKLGINLICSNTKATNTSTDISLLQVNNTISWTTLNQQQIERKKSGLSASINLSHDNNKKFAGNFLFQFNHLSRQSNYSDLTSIAIADTLLENFTSTFKIFNVGYNGAIKIARNKLLNFNVSYNDIPENSRISYDTKRFAQYWNFNENYYNLYQQTILRTSYKSAELALLTKLNKHSIKASIRFQEERLYGDDKVWLPRLSAYFINPASKLLVSRNYFSKVIYVRDFNTKISFDFSSDIGLGSFKNFGVTNNFRNKIIWEVNANFRKKIVPNTNLSFSASSIRQLPKLYLFYCDSILSANVSIYQSTKEFSLIRSDALNFSYTINRYKTNAYLSFNSWVKKNYSNYISNSFFNPLVIENAYTPIKNSINTGLGLSAKSYLFPLKSIASFSMNYQIEKGEKIINNILSNAVDKNGAGNFGLATSFKIPINFEVIYNFFLYKGALKNANTDLYASNYFYNITNKIRFQANKKYFTGIQLTYWKLSEKDNILSDFFGSYIISKTKSLDLKIHNIFNCKTFDRKNISANSTNYNQFALVPRYFLLRFTIIF